MRRKSGMGVILSGCLFAALWAGGAPALRAQQSVSVTGYQVDEGDQAVPPAALDGWPAPGSAKAADADAGPVRMARFSYLKGDVSWRPGESGDWATAAVNLPIRQGAQIWASGHSRAEIQFDDGSLLRLGADAVITLQTLYSDSQGEFTELRLSQGLASLSLPHGKSLFQIDTPDVSVKAAGPAKLRAGVASGTEIAVRQGKANIEDAHGKTFLQAGDYIDITDANAPFNIQDVPAEDGWDRFGDARDRVMAQGAQDRNVPSDIGLVAGNLDDYGQWHADPAYGQVWVPAEPTDWRPYHDGHWVWVEPFGWTWVGDEPWGWAPYHYGSWVHAAYGWGWCPGPRVQYWSPAVVDFVGCNGYVAWAPLAPYEVRYPSVFSVGFGGGDWATFFSIGGCATYNYAGGHDYAPRRWDNRYCNRWNDRDFSGDRFTHEHGFYGAPDRVAPARGGWVPANARLADGVSRVRPDGFGGAGRFESVARSEGASLWTHGHSIVAEGGRPLAGPTVVRPTPASFTPAHTFLMGVQAPQGVLARPVYRTPLAPSIARVGGSSGRFLTPSNRVPAPAFRAGGQSAFGAFGGRVSTPTGNLPALPGGQAPFGRGRSTFGDRRPGFGAILPEGQPVLSPGAAASQARASLNLPQPTGAVTAPGGVFRRSGPGGLRGNWPGVTPGGSVLRGDGSRDFPGGGSVPASQGFPRMLPAFPQGVRTDAGRVGSFGPSNDIRPPAPAGFPGGLGGGFHGDRARSAPGGGEPRVSAPASGREPRAGGLSGAVPGGGGFGAHVH